AVTPTVFNKKKANVTDITTVTKRVTAEDGTLKSANITMQHVSNDTEVHNTPIVGYAIAVEPDGTYEVHYTYNTASFNINKDSRLAISLHKSKHHVQDIVSGIAIPAHLTGTELRTYLDSQLSENFGNPAVHRSNVTTEQIVVADPTASYGDKLTLKQGDHAGSSQFLGMHMAGKELEAVTEEFSANQLAFVKRKGNHTIHVNHLA
ncbi:MAG: hypothetical protein KAG66_14255, partial [Methylococcales bacterium]|nr:hypothetical protein [Methylococcales bacterium]